MKYFPLYIVFLFLVACSPKAEDKTISEDVSANIGTVHLTEKQFNEGGFEVAPIGLEKLASPLQVQGKVVVLPEAYYSIAFPLRARATQILVKLGEKVRKGQVLLVVEDIGLIELQQNYLTTLSDFRFAKLELERQKELQITSATSKRNEQQAQANYDRINALLRSYQEQLSLMGISATNLQADNIRKSVNITAPMNGVISTLNVIKGAYFDSNQSLMELLDISKTETHIQLFQEDMKQIKIGEEVTAEVNGITMNGRIARLVPNLDANNSGSAIVDWNNKEDLFIGSMFKVQIQQHQMDVLAVPSEAVLNWNGKKYVFIKKADLQFEMIEVEILIENETKIGVKGNFTNDDQVVIKNAYTLLRMMKNEAED